MAELADAPDLGSGGTPRAGSSPVIRIVAENKGIQRLLRLLDALIFMPFDINADINGRETAKKK